jgi:hypothetical protein
MASHANLCLKDLPESPGLGGNSKIDNNDAAKPQFPERPLRNGSMNSF